MPTTIAAQAQVASRTEPAIGGEGKKASRIQVVNPLADDLHANDQNQEQDLPVEARLAQVAANPAIDAEIDEGRERPDFLFFDKLSVEPCCNGDRKIEGQRQIFVVKHGRQRKRRSHRRAPTRVPEGCRG